MQIREVMSHDVELIPSTAPLKEAAHKMKSWDIGLLPVRDGDRLVGMISDRDITVRATAEGFDPSNTQVGNVMTPEVVYCFEDQDLKDAASVMEARQIRRLPILNRDKRLVGIVALGDLAVQTLDEKLAGKTLQQVSRKKRQGESPRS